MIDYLVRLPVSVEVRLPRPGRLQHKRCGGNKSGISWLTNWRRANRRLRRQQLSAFCGGAKARAAKMIDDVGRLPVLAVIHVGGNTTMRKQEERKVATPHSIDARSVPPKRTFWDTIWDTFLVYNLRLRKSLPCKDLKYARRKCSPKGWNDRRTIENQRTAATCPAWSGAE